MVGRNPATSTTAPLLLDIRTTTGGAPTEPNAGGNILASLSIAATMFPLGSIPTTFTSIDLTALALGVTSRDVMAVVLRSAGDNPAYSWTGSSTGGAANNYADGSAYRRVFTTTWTVPGFANDFAFQTFVEPSSAAVPEPSTLALAGFGSILLIAYRRRRRG